MDTPRVIGLDLSADATGVALPDGSTFTIHAPAAKGKKRTFDDNMHRLDHVTAMAERTLDDHRPDLAVIEDYAAGIRSSSAHRLAEIGGTIRLACRRRQVPMVLVNVMHVKMYAAGSTRADKADLRMALYKRAGLDIADDNQADAWWIRAMGMDALGHPVLEMPKAHRAVLAKADWPQLEVAR